MNLRVTIGCSVLLSCVVLLVSASAMNRRQESARVEGHGKVVRLADAVQQPRDNSKICVDLTKGGPADAINPGLEKVARYVNIYAAAGSEPARCRIIVVLHGAATSIALNDKAYAEHLGENGNPNLELLEKLERAGVDFVVCGQSMSSKGYDHQQTNKHVHVAVSALTANVNCQTDGFAFIPLH